MYSITKDGFRIIFLVVSTSSFILKLISEESLTEFKDTWTSVALKSNNADTYLNQVQSSLLCCGYENPADFPLGNCTHRGKREKFHRFLIKY